VVAFAVLATSLPAFPRDGVAAGAGEAPAGKDPAAGAAESGDEKALPSVATHRPELELGRSEQYDYDPPVPGTYELPVIKPAGDGNVLTPDGKTRRLRDILEGHITILSFIYTRCADPTACPMASGALYEVEGVSEEDPAIARNLRLVSFSFDPDHDTPRVMAEYGSRYKSDEKKGCEWLFLTTKGTKELEPILEQYGQRVDRKKNPADPFGPFYHVVRVYLVDRNAMVRNIYSFGMMDPRMLLADVRTLIIESSARAGTR
jgi:cytochrome oxidase Cu insertion factor (SCO1/SenC/PrrC family)